MDRKQNNMKHNTEDSSFMTNREMIREIYNTVGDMKGNLSVLKTIQDIDTKRIDDHDKTISEYKKFKWIATGATFGGFAGTIAWVKQHLGI